MIDYVELMNNTALLKSAKQLFEIYFIADDYDEIAVFKAELQEQIDKNEKDMEDFDKWLTMKEEEAKLESQWEDRGPRKEEGEDW